MAFSVTILLVVLALLFVALWGFFGEFPNNWEWVGVVLAGVGVAMASPTIFQAIWGHPTMRTQFERAVEGAERFLAIYVENPPVKNRLLRRLGVRRQTVQSLAVQFRIVEAGSNKIIVPIHNARIHTDDDPDGTGRWRVALPPTFSVGACIMIVRWDVQQKRALIPPDRSREARPLDQGSYRAILFFMVDGEPIHIHREFIVGEKADDLDWVTPPNQ